ncbi:MAG: MBL fold metallo-hydrolase [Muribaculaceae bacterium]|nr:MBL fold metallo-hydrolase [Muribaculaceae bacterium]
MFGVNTYVVWDPDSLEALVIDPGMIDEEECRAIDSFIARNSLKLKRLINTHMHLDHIFGNEYVRSKYDLDIEAAREDDFLGRSLSAQAREFRMPLEVTDRGLDREIHDGDVIKIGSGSLKVLAVPGHSPGSMALWSEGSGFVITGDALFRGSIGRTDLPGGDFATLVKSIRTRLLTLPDNTVVLPGHGDETTIGWEKAHNYMLK